MISPARLLVISFATTILIGAVLLFLPISRVGPTPRQPVDALFTSTSAVCVTGLIVLDTGRDHSLFGQAVILGLIQIGGLGIMTFSNLILLAAGKKLGLSQRMVLEATHGEVLAVSPAQLIRRILLYTFTLEALGTLLLWVRFRSEYPLPRAVWLAVFHSISAFCNAGFSLFSDSFMGYRDDFLVNITVMGLIVAGGLGFVVFADVFSFLGDWRVKGKLRRLTLHSRVVLCTTVGLILGGALLLGVLEISNLLGGGPWHQPILSSLFLSITARTAGFNTMDTAQLTNATLLCVIVLMVIGASPGSTGGGIKTTTFAALWAMVFSRARNRPQTEMLDRTIPSEVIAKALATTAGFLLAILLGVILLQITEYAGQPHTAVRGLFLGHLFEVVSALGTVGLSTGVTPTLSAAGKGVIIACMFVGRLGPLVVAASLIGRRPRAAYTLPEERLMIG